MGKTRRVRWLSMFESNAVKMHGVPRTNPPLLLYSRMPSYF